MSDYNELIAGDLAEASIPLLKALNAGELMNFRGIATMFALSSTMMHEMQKGTVLPPETDLQAAQCLEIMNQNPLCIMSVLAQLSKIALEVHYGKNKEHA